ncbi:MAG: hypothetical protein L3J33_02230 [Rhodobacteraceae bacterium]|nr:hypothetical protein [Paracoccaceae bacterium]
MPYETVKISDLVVNPNNDRHGPLDSEEAAIKWLFENRFEEMKGLAKDIATQGKVFDAPLIYKSNNKFIVYDGNRRTACLKILLGLTQAPQKVALFFQSLRAEIKTPIPEAIECQVEPDFETISKILTRRHSGKLEGEGQIKWDTRAKANYAERAGGQSAYPISEKIEQYLEKKGYPNSTKIPRSNLAKIIDTKYRKSRIGVDLDQSKNLKFTKDENAVYPLLVKIADDLISGKLSLKQLLLSEDKNKYLDDLSEQGFSLSPTNSKKGKPSGENRSGPSGKRPKVRRTLIPQDIHHTVDWRHGQSKIKALWEQLQYQLKLGTHSLSIAIVFRVFLEQVTDNYIGKHSLKNKGALNKNIVVVSSELLRNNLFDEKQHRDVERKVNDAKSLSSIASLQRVLHSKSDLPANSDMVSLWDSLEPYILGAIKN